MKKGSFVGDVCLAGFARHGSGLVPFRARRGPSNPSAPWSWWSCAFDEGRRSAGQPNADEYNAVSHIPKGKANTQDVDESTVGARKDHETESARREGVVNDTQPAVCRACNVW